MKSKILTMSIVFTLAFVVTGCNPKVPSASESMIGMIGEAFRSVRAASITTPCNWDNTNWDACNWE